MKRNFLLLARYLLAIVFIFSGFVKGIDPWGTAYKLFDYFTAFHLHFLNDLTLPFAVILCVAELYLGLLLLFGANPRNAAWGSFIFMAVFTPLTLILAITNPISDCGCFGDAIKLSNWGTFYKNIVLFAAAAYLFANRKELKAKHSNFRKRAVSILLLVIALAPSIHGIRHQPLIDFRPFHLGVNLLQYTKIPEDKPHDVYRTILYYQKDGEVKEFDETNYPWDDSTWTFVDSKSFLVEKGYTPPITNFILYNEHGQNYTDTILYSKGDLILVVVPSVKYLSEPAIAKFKTVQKQARDKGITVFGLTSAAGTDLANLENKHGLFFTWLQADEVMLKTIVRSYPGMLYLYDGTIVGKWHWRDIPEKLFKTEQPLPFLVTATQKKWEYAIALVLSLSLILILLVFNRNK
ncbi:MAG TPA: DoxX family membrane protein [Bacteroidales bacterium]|nr:DoxX family membrane protein [Bacteroidales bacterium]